MESSCGDPGGPMDSLGKCFLTMWTSQCYIVSHHDDDDDCGDDGDDLEEEEIMLVMVKTSKPGNSGKY